MTTDISFVSSMAELAEASYADLSNKSDPAVKAALQNTDGGTKFSLTQATEFVNNWDVLDQMPNTDSGFSATLFHSTTDGYVFAIRGTEFDTIDLAADSEIVLYGLSTRKA